MRSVFNAHRIACVTNERDEALGPVAKRRFTRCFDMNEAPPRKQPQKKFRSMDVVAVSPLLDLGRFEGWQQGREISTQRHEWVDVLHELNTAETVRVVMGTEEELCTVFPQNSISASLLNLVPSFKRFCVAVDDESVALPTSLVREALWAGWCARASEKANSEARIAELDDYVLLP